MRRAIGALVALLLSSPAARAETDGQRVLNLVLLAAAETAIAVDVLQTIDMNRHPEGHYFEVNPFLGGHPSNGRIIALATCGAIGTAALWYAVPSKIRWVVPAVVLAMEALAITGNVQAGLSIAL
jgi:hypothetical protein